MAEGLKNTRILLTNDDGIHAPGLEVLERIARALSDDVWVVAPETEQSGAGHSLTLSNPVRLREIAPRRYAVAGTPTDCVAMALRHVLIGHKPGLILSGVNRGGNLADDVTYSGTIAAAMEGTLFDVPSIALSQFFSREHSADRFAAAEAHGAALIARLVAQGWPRDVLLNVNFPAASAEDVKGVRVTLQGLRTESDLIVDERRDARGVPYFWFGFSGRSLGNEPGTDLEAISTGFISVTPLHLDLTHFETHRGLKLALDQVF